MSPRYRDVDIPAPAEIDVHEGLAYALYLPPGAPRGAVVVLHGAGSCKESHFDFARACRTSGLAALAFDARGHGDSGGALGAGALDDVAAMAALASSRAGDVPVALRGSSMGGFLALAAARRVRARGVVAICPASVDGLLRGLRADELGFAADRPALEELIGAVDLTAEAAALSDRLLLLHAEGDERVPVQHSDALHAASPGSRYLRMPGGHHRSLQHDGELQGYTTKFLVAALEG